MGHGATPKKNGVGRGVATFAATTPGLGAMLIIAATLGYPLYRLLKAIDDRLREPEDDYVFASGGSSDALRMRLKRLPKLPRMVIPDGRCALSYMKVNPCRNCLVNSAERGFPWSITKRRINHFLN